MKTLINYTNERLNKWYSNAKLDYNLIGSGVSKIENDKFIIEYIENGISKVWSMYFELEYSKNNISYFFDVWMDEAK